MTGRLFAAWAAALGLGAVLLAHPAWGWRQTAAAATAALLASLLVALARPGELRPPAALWGSAALLAGAALLSVLASADAEWTGLAPLAGQLLFLAFGWWLAVAVRALRVLVGGLLAGAALAGLYAALQHWGLDPLPPATRFDRERIVSFFENPNYLGDFAAGSLPLALAVFLQVQRAGARLGAGLGVGLVYSGWLLAGSRGAWGAGLVGVGVVLGAWGWQVRRKQALRRLPDLTLLGVLLTGLTLLFSGRPVQAPEGPVSMAERALSSRHLLSPYARSGTAEAPGDSFQVRDATINHRHFIWRVSWEMVRTHPFLGLGYGTYASHFPAFRDGLSEADHFRTLSWVQRQESTLHAHNEYLHLWAESGPLALLGFLGVVLLGLVRAVRGAGGGSLYLWGAVGLVLAGLVHSLFSYPLHLPLNGAIFWLALGVVWRRGASDPN